jgi:hypothetical protein
MSYLDGQKGQGGKVAPKEEEEEGEEEEEETMLLESSLDPSIGRWQALVVERGMVGGREGWGWRSIYARRRGRRI